MATSIAAQYDYFIMAMQWSPALCRMENCVKKPISEFTIHGLWASNKTAGQVPLQCSKVQKVINLTPAMISKPTETELHTSWPTFIESDDFAFWKKEWINHSTCSYSTYNQTQFFDVANRLWKSFGSIFDILHRANISPSTTVYQTRQAFLTPIRNHIGIPGLDIELHCPSSTELLEIRLCLNHAGNAYQNCPNNGTCGLTSFKWKPL